MLELLENDISLRKWSGGMQRSCAPWKEHRLWIWFTYSSPESRKWHFMKNTTCSWTIPKITKLVF